MLLLSLLSDSDLELLEKSVFQILEKVGMMYQSDRILDALSRLGAKVDYSTNIARLPRQLLTEIIARQKLRPWQYERQIHPVAAGEYRVGLGLQVAQFYYDYDRRERRPGNRQDLIQLIHFGDALGDDLSVSHVLLMREEPFQVEPLEALSLLLEHARRPGYTYPHFTEQFPYLAEIGDIVTGDPTYYLVGGIFVVSPLRMDKRASDFLVKKLEHGVPCYIGTQPVAGASAPVTMAGTIAAGAAEILAGWTASYALNPEIHLSGAVCSGILDMRTSDVSFCSPEAMLQDIGLCELFRRLWGGHVTIAGGSDYTDAKLPGLQASFEKTFEAMAISAYTGRHPRMGNGLLESGKTFSPVQLLLDQEMGEALWKFAKGIVVNDETIALDSILEVGIGIGKTYIEIEHTLKHFRQSVWYPKFLDRGVWKGTEFEDERKMLDRVNEQFKEILSSYQPPDVDEEKLNAVRRVVERARRELLK